jgi:hypothetical protein
MKVTDLPIELAQIVTEKLLAANAGNATSVCSDLQAWCRTHPVACKDDNMWRLAFEALYIYPPGPVPSAPPPVPDKPYKDDFGITGPLPQPPQPPRYDPRLVPKDDSDSPSDSGYHSDDSWPLSDSDNKYRGVPYWLEPTEPIRVLDESFLSAEGKAEYARYKEEYARYYEEKARYDEKLTQYNMALGEYHVANYNHDKTETLIQEHQLRVAAVTAKRAALAANPPASYRDAFTNVCMRIDQVRNGNPEAIKHVHPELLRSETFMRNVAAVDARVLYEATLVDDDDEDGDMFMDEMWRQAVRNNPRNRRWQQARVQR